jgi:hypothetical protein
MWVHACLCRRAADADALTHAGHGRNESGVKVPELRRDVQELGRRRSISNKA